MFILGVSNDHDRAAYLMKDGKIIVGIEQERLDRIKHSTSSCLPWEAINYCLDYAGIKVEQVDLVVASGLKNIIKLREQLVIFSKVHILSHHLAHAYSAFYSSPFEEAIVFVADGKGNSFDLLTENYANKDPNLYEAESFYHVENNKFFILDKKGFPSPEKVYENIRKDDKDALDADISLGRMYSSVASYIFGNWQYAGKVMGLAPFGNKERFEKTNLVECCDGQIKIKSYKLMEQLKNPKDWTKTENIKEYEDLSFKVQKELEKAIIYKLNYIYKQKPCKNICLAGGINLNCIVNYKILQETPFENLYIPPATGDSGLALGCAYYGYYEIVKGNARFELTNAYLGKTYSQEETLSAINYYIDDNYLQSKFDIKIYDQQDNIFFNDVAKLLTEQYIIGWFQGRSEIGPRALGHRSIIVDPRRAEMKDILNNKVKHRENFRPFAASILEEFTSEYFKLDRPSPFMLLIAGLVEDKICKIPAINHVDNTARVQTVNSKDNPIYYKLIDAFRNLTGTPVVLNTSFNIAGEPIVESPLDAFKSFSKTNIDYLIINNIIISKIKKESL